MSGNKTPNNQDILILYLALVVSLALTLAYFLFDFVMKNTSLKGFLQGISGNIIATTLSFLIIYTFLTRNNISLGPSENPSQRVINDIKERTERLKLELFSKIDRLRDQIGDEVDTKFNLNNNSPLSMKFDLLKSDLILQIQQMSKQIGKEVNTKLDLDSNELYKFYGLKEARLGVTFQNFSVTRDSDDENVNPVSFLWADTYRGNTINGSILREIEPFLRVEFQSFESSWGCNIAIRPQDEKAVDIKRQGELNYLYFQARIPTEALQDMNMLHDVGIAVRLVNGKYQHWNYGGRAGEYIQFQVRDDGTWTIFCLDIQDKRKWSHFESDGNPNINEEETRNADLSIISAVILKFGKFIGIRGELGYGKGKVDIRDIRFSPTQIRM